MTSRLWMLLVAAALLALGGPGLAQEPDARTILQTALKAMGDLKSIQYSGSTGYVSVVGQNYSPANDWPANQLTSYTRTIDYEGKSSKEEVTLKQGTGQGGPTGGGNAPVITTPLVGEQQRTSIVSGNYAWNMQGTTVVPAPADAEQRQLEIWLTPHGCLKAALAPGANPIAVERNEQGKGRIRAVSFMALGKYRVQCAINDKNLVDRTQTWFANPVVGDLYYELVLTNYKDFGGVMFPTNFHAHHDLDDDLEGEGVNVSGGHNSFGLTVSNVQANVSGAALTVPDAVRQATIPPIRVESQKAADGVWYVGGGTHASVAVEFRDFITVIEAPLNEDRSLAVIAEVKKLIPNKPIRYLVARTTTGTTSAESALRPPGGRDHRLAAIESRLLRRSLVGTAVDLETRQAVLFPPEEIAEGYTFESVGQKYVLTDGTKVMEVYNVQGLAHAQGMLIAISPRRGW